MSTPITHQAAVRNVRQAKSELDAATQATNEAAQKYQLLLQRTKSLNEEVKDLTIKADKHPRKYGPALAKAKEALTKANAELVKQQTVVQDLSTRQVREVGELEGAKHEAFDAAKREKVGAAFWTDSLEDAASLSLDKQRQLIGTEIGIGAAKALVADVKSVQEAVQRLPPADALGVLNQKLQGIDPANQAAFLDQLRPQLKALVTPAATMTIMDHSAQAVGEKYLEAMAGISPEARKVMTTAFAEAVGTTPGWREGVNHVASTGLGAALRESLASGAKHFATAAELTDALAAANKPEAAAGIRSLVADRAYELRSTFEKKEKVVQRLRGELALLNQGVGSLMTDPQRMKAIDAFKAQHAKEFAAFDKAAGDYSEVLSALRGQAASPTDGGRTTFRDNTQFDSEMAALTKHLPSIQSTPEGEKQVLAALDAQAKGFGPPWLAELTKVVGNTKSVTEGTANVIAMGIAQLAARGSLTGQHQVAMLLEKNAGALGISKKSLEVLDEAFNSLDGTKESVAKVQQALKDVEGGSFGGKGVNTGLRVIGLAVAFHGLATSVNGWKDAELTARMKTVVDGMSLGADGAKLTLELFGKEATAKTLGRYAGGLALAGGVLDGVASIKAFRDGDIGAGVANGLTSAGGLLMGAAAISGSFPGGQLAGAALAVAGLVTNIIVGQREVAKAERASEKDALEYLQAGGVGKDAAKVLANVRETDHRNAGVPIRQIAERLDLDPNALFVKLQALPPEKLDQFVKRMLSVELNRDGTVKEGPLGRNGLKIDSATVSYQGYAANGGAAVIENYPRSLATATEWAKAFFAENGI